MFQRHFKDVRVFQGHFKGDLRDVSSMFQRNFRRVSRAFQESFKKFQGCFKKFCECFKIVLRVFQRS